MQDFAKAACRSIIAGALKHRPVSGAIFHAFAVMSDFAVLTSQDGIAAGHLAKILRHFWRSMLC